MSSTDSLMYAGDTANMQAGGGSFFDDATAAVAGAAVSGVYGILNTAVNISNKVFGTNADQFDTLSTLDSIDKNWGNFYSQHKEGIDTAGFLATSLIPGGLAVKGLKLAQEGRFGAMAGKVFGFTSSRETYYLNNALKAIETEGGTVFARINKDKIASMVWGAADNVLQTAAFETGVAASMSASPFFEKDQWNAIALDIAKTSLVGGAVGGLIGGLFTSKLIRDVGKEVESRTRAVDALSQLGELDVAFGDRAYNLLDSGLKLGNVLKEKTADEIEKLSNVAIPSGRNGIIKSLNISPLLTRTASTTQDRALLQFQDALTHVVPNDYSVGRPVGTAFVRMITQGLKDGIEDSEIRKTMLGYLGGLKNIEALGSAPTTIGEGLRYLSPKAKLDGKSLSIFSDTPREGDLIYRLLDGEESLRFEILGKNTPTLKHAWEAGFDVAMDPVTKDLKVNPNSKRLLKLTPEEAKDTWTFFNTKTGQTVDNVMPTIADVATQPSPLKVTAIGVTSGKHQFTFTPASAQFALPSTGLEATARSLWASKGLGIVRDEISVNDFAITDALLNDNLKAASNLQVKLPTGTVVPYKDLQQQLPDVVLNAKLTQLQHLYADAAAAGKVLDTREVAQIVNAEPAWVEKAIALKFDAQEASKIEGAIIDGSKLTDRENVIFRYDTPAKDAPPQDAVLNWYTRIKEATDKAQTAAKAVLGDYADLLIPLTPGQTLTAGASQTGVGASFAGFSNVGYNDALGVWAQNTGAAVNKMKQEIPRNILTELQGPAQAVVMDKSAAAEVAAIMNKARLTPDGIGLWTDPMSGKSYVVDLPSLLSQGKARGFKESIEIKSQAAADLLLTYQKQHNAWMEKDRVLRAAVGEDSKLSPLRLYAPPLDTSRYPYFAFVRQREGYLFGRSESAMVTARSADELQQKVAEIQKDSRLQVIFKDGSEEYHKAKGDYDIGRAMNNPVVNDLLASKQLLGDMVPNMTPEAVVEDFVRFTQRREEKLIRDSVELHFGQQFAELRDLSSRYTQLQTSKLETPASKFVRNVSDPFGDYVRTALDVSKESSFTLWHQANEFVDAMGTRAWQAVEKATLDARNEKISWEDASNTMTRYGLGKFYADAEMFTPEMFAAAQTGTDRNLFRQAINKANSLLSITNLRLDWANSILQAISMPVMLGPEVASIRRSLAKDPELFAQLQSTMSVVDPGTKLAVPSTTKLLMGAIKNYASKDGDALAERYRNLGLISSERQQIHAMLDDLSIQPKLSSAEFSAKVDGWVDKAAMLTGNTRVEEMTRFVAADVMRQITEPLVAAGNMTAKEQDAFMRIFVNRVQGNYVASQRPIMFQGTIGAAIGLFQTYQFNVFQQLFRHIEDRNFASLATFAGMQSSLFGLNGLPFFDALNTQIIGNASINAGHKDLHSAAVGMFGKDVGDWLLYGTPSAFPLLPEKMPALYSRGDLNPRNLTMVPTNPADVPAVQAASKLVGFVTGFARQVSGGDGMTTAFLNALEHNGLNRPLAGLAQLAKGNVTTQSGDLIAAQSDLYSLASLSRLVGARPMDEAIGVNEVYRSKVYQAADKQKLELLGSVVKDKIRGGQEVSSEDWLDLQSQYAAAGGRIENFGSAVKRWTKNANVSVLNSLREHQNTLAGQRMTMTLGGDPIEDYTTGMQQQ